MPKNPATCPGISEFIQPKPSYTKCPRCDAEVEIWSDENETQCPNCGLMVTKGKGQSCLDWCEQADKCRELIEARRKEKE